MEKLKVGIIDVETSPLTAYAWGRHDVNIALNQVVKDWRLLCAAWKWLGGKQIAFAEARNDKDEKALLQKIWAFLDTADILITQNGKAFDSKKLNARFIMHGMKPPSPYKHLDTYLIAKSAGAFTANSLEYLTDKLCVKYKKLTHKKFPGMALWTECLKGNSAAWAEMKKYNIHDVLATEELYGKLKAWVPANAPPVYVGEGCQVCGARDMVKWGSRPSKSGLMVRRFCKHCGKWQERLLKKAA